MVVFYQDGSGKQNLPDRPETPSQGNSTDNVNNTIGATVIAMRMVCIKLITLNV